MTLVSPNLVDTLLHPHLGPQQHASHGTSPLSQVSCPWVLRCCSLLVGLRPHTLMLEPRLSLLTCAAFFTWTHKVGVAQDQGLAFLSSRSSFLPKWLHLFPWLYVPLLLVTLKFTHSAKTSLTSDFYTHVWWPMWHLHMNVSQLDVTCPKLNSWFPLLSKQMLLAGSASSLPSRPSANLTHFISAPLHLLPPPLQPAPSPCISAAVSNWPPHTRSCFPISCSPHSWVVIKTQKTTPVTLCCKSSRDFLWTLSKIQAPCFSLQGGSCGAYLLFFTLLLFHLGLTLFYFLEPPRFFWSQGLCTFL